MDFYILFSSNNKVLAVCQNGELLACETKKAASPPFILLTSKKVEISINTYKICKYY